MSVRDLNGAMQASISSHDDSEYTITAKDGKPATHFRDAKDAMHFLKNPLYKTSEGFRREVARLLANSPHVGFGGHGGNEETQQEAARQQEQGRQIVMEQARALFSDPRYKSSPSYRLYVENFIKEHGGLYDAYEPQTALHQELSIPRHISVQDKHGETGPLSPRNWLT